jgi:hypothetical protein
MNRVILSPHFTYEEMIFSSKAEGLGIKNEPGPKELENLARLCDLLERCRALVGPLVVNSGYRCEALNKAVGGVKTSAHQDGRAADVVPSRMTVQDAFAKLRASSIAFDQLILEPTWIHIGIAREGQVPRLNYLFAIPTEHGMRYEVAP